MADPDRGAVAGCPGAVWAPGGRVYDLFRRWQRNGTWQRIFTHLPIGLNRVRESRSG